MAAERAPNPAAWRILRGGGFRRLWVAQLVAGLGDWIAMLAIIEFAVRVSARPEIGISAVMSARLVAGLLFAAPAGAIADRQSRRRTMMACHVGRAAILAAVPFSESLLMLVIASFGLEIFATLWAPAKEASVPNLVAVDELPAANALSLAAAYGTFPIGALAFAALVYPGRWLSERAPVVGLEAPALWAAGSLFVLGAYTLRRLHLPHRPRSTSPPPRQRRRRGGGRAALTRALPLHVRAVFAGLAVGLLAAGSLIPLGPVYVHYVLGAGEGTFGLLMAGLGFGVAGAVIVLALTPLRLPPTGAFLTATVVSGVAIFAAASSPSPAVALVALLVLGVGAGVVYLTSFSIVQTEVPDDLRGRAFAALYATVRVALLGALTLWPLASVGLDALSERVFDDARVHVGPWVVALPGVRLALWLAAVAVLVTALIVHRMLRRAHAPAAPHGTAEHTASEPPHRLLSDRRAPVAPDDGTTALR